MTSEMVLPENRVPRASWIILALVATLTMLSGLFVGLTPVGSTPEDMRKKMRAESAEVAKLVKAIGYQPQ